MSLLLTHPTRRLHGRIQLNGSKSISNRLLVLKALAFEPLELDGISTAEDTATLQALLEAVSRNTSPAAPLDVGAAGTSFRFLTALLALYPGEQVLTGSKRMKQRPIAPLVDALRQLGARIEYIEAEGFPPLRIGAAALDKTSVVTLDADTSSQFVTALLLIAPRLPNGLELHLERKVVSRPYIDLTLGLLRRTGIKADWLDSQRIRVEPGFIRGGRYTVEADWSAASYFYGMGTVADSVDLYLNGLQSDSLQGDAQVAELMSSFGIRTEFTETGAHLSGSGMPSKAHFDYDFQNTPDLAQTLATVCSAKGINALLTGLDTLRVKETDRIEALQTELLKVGTYLTPLPQRFSKRQSKQFFMLEGKAEMPASPPEFDTYDDHRMAMAFALFSMLGTVVIKHPEVVGKSYPRFWKDLQSLGFIMREV